MKWRQRDGMADPGARRARVVLLACMIVAATGLSSRAETLRAVFDEGATSRKWTLAELGPGLPRDWSPYNFLVMEMKASSPQWFELRIHSGGAVRGMRLLPFEGALVRAAVPLGRFRDQATAGHDLASVGNKPRAMFGTTWAWNQGPLDDVTAIEVTMNQPVGRPSLEIRSVRLAKGDPGDALLDSKPLVDEFGQWISADWPGKARSLDDLKAAWSKEAAAFVGGTRAGCVCGGEASTKAHATGFFRVEQVDGRWWFVDPDGHLFFSLGVDVVTPFIATRTEGRAGVFAQAPAAEPTAGGRRGLRGGASFFTQNLARRFGDQWPAKWVEMTCSRMTAWGLNTVGSWSDPRLWATPRVPYTVILGGWGIETGVMGLPDVYDSDWTRKVDDTARQCSLRKNDPYLLGYFIGNEPAWPGRETVVAALVLKGKDTAMRRELTKFLADGDTPSRRKEFILKSFDRMLAVVNAAVRKHDPNHLNLGIRFGGSPHEDVIRAARVFDVFSLNIYAVAPDQRRLDTIAQLTGRPILIGEYHIGTPGRGMAAGLVQARDQAERGVAYRYYVEHAAAHPSLVGTHWFQWVDEPSTGRFDGENYNIGLVDVTDRPYPDLVDALKATHRDLFDVHAGRRKPTDQKAKAR